MNRIYLRFNKYGGLKITENNREFVEKVLDTSVNEEFWLKNNQEKGLRFYLCSQEKELLLKEQTKYNRNLKFKTKFDKLINE
jgi:hypothetical protein